ncbi:MAG: patatin-like phospholipase family protein [Cyanobacteriota bacterium]|nr:patatin-like phospholipase family protein [Cyanobacteriota bacterium]
MSVQPPSLEQHFAPVGPKRILSLDGGGVRGILSLAFLERIERILRERHGNDPDFRLSHYFDLIAGTSTGSILAALLAQGQSVAEITTLYLQLADQVFRRHWWDPRSGIFRPRYNPRDLATFLRHRLGPECRIGDQNLLKTGLLVMCKRMDSGSPWPISNNPRGRFFHPKPGQPTIANRDYNLWQVVRASTAAPTFFQPEEIQISSPLLPSQKPLLGKFIDGGVSPHKNPSLQAYWLATLRGYGLRWPVGRDQLLIISVGTGRIPESRSSSWMSALQGITALRSLMDDCSELVECLMQGMGHCLNPPREIDPELSTLSPHELVQEPCFSYARYDVKLYRDPRARDGQLDDVYLQELQLSDAHLMQMHKMDNAKSMRLLLELGRVAAEGKVSVEHLPQAFDLPVVPAGGVTSNQQLVVEPLFPSDLQPYRERKETEVKAIRLNLELESFTYHQGDGARTGKRGDWLVECEGRVSTVDHATFNRYYKQVAPASYRKQLIVWAAPVSDGVLVCMDSEGKDGDVLSPDQFQALYEPLPQPERIVRQP